MKSIDNSGMFEKAKQVPTELSKEVVLEFIASIPTLPPPTNNWFQNFNLNSIIMTTTVITVVTSAILYFSTPNNEENLQPIPQNVPEVEQEQTIYTDTTQEEVSAVDTAPKEGEPPNEQQTTPSKPNKKANIQPAQVTRSQEEPNDTTSSIGSLIPSLNHLDAGQAVQFNTSPTKTSPISLTGAQLRSLKSKLIKYVKQDGLNRSNYNFIIVEFNKRKPKINHHTLTPPQIKRYEDLLASYNVSYSPQRRIVVDKKYIMVGDFTEEGFSGSALGRAMDIQFKGYDNGEDFDLFSDEKITNGSPTKSDTLRSIRQVTVSPIAEPKRTGGSFFQPYAPPRPAPPIIRGKGGQEEYNIVFKQSKNPSIFDKSGVRKRNILTRKKLKQLRRAVYDVLYKADVISSKKVDVRIELNPELLTVNREKVSDLVNLDLRDVFLKYDVSSGSHTKLLMNNEFIMLGDFKDNKFNGSVTGELNSKDIQESIFNDDFKEISMFGLDTISKIDDN
ncbi:hypothetical protein [Roseivirga misakiensis]|uniref:Uncharacterized protein n=1 Tax=Roseivirga misakiensis TaxID=1563681 RepID=A0A1E5SYB2_9BACT|nr:hypothetical protein [Roseivirga misakiensis]OEK04101.1 hypothetical protein BFP71_11480 [Roseivirga misakiensis]